MTSALAQIVSSSSHPRKCSIRICTKKNCWKQGGKELWRALERKIEESGMAGAVKLKAVKYLDRCKRAPNLDCGDTQIERCTVEEAVRILDQMATARNSMKSRPKVPR